MKSLITRRIVSLFSIILLTVFFSACGSTSATPAQAAALKPSPASYKGFRQLTGANFTIAYPVGWQTSQKSLPGGKPGKPATGIYGFVAPDNLPGLHIVRNGDE